MKQHQLVVALAVCVLGVGVMPAGVATASGASDTQAAKALVVTAADAGSPYRETPAAAIPHLFPEIAACVGTPSPARVISATTDAPLLTTADGKALVSYVEIVKTKAMAKADRAVFRSPKFADCVKQVFQSRETARGGTVDVHPDTTLGKKFGDTTVALDVQTQRNGQTSNAVEVNIQKGRAEMLVALSAASAAVSAADLKTVLQKLGKRLAKAKVS